MSLVVSLAAIVLVLYSVGWKPDWSALWTAIESGSVRLFTAPFSDWSMVAKRIALVVAVLLTFLSEVPLLPPVHVAPAAVTHTLTASEALQAFQSAMGLNPDGVLGPKTLAALQRAYSKKGH